MPTGTSRWCCRADDTTGQLDADRRRSPDTDGAALLLRLGHRGGVVAAHRAARRRGGPERPFARSCRGGVAAVGRARRLRPRQPGSSFCNSVPRRRPNGFLPPIDRTDIGAAAENRPVIGRWELATGRSADRGSRTARRHLLELFHRQSVVGDDPLRAPPVQPECPSGSRRIPTAWCEWCCVSAIPGSRIGLTQRATATAQSSCAACAPKRRRHRRRGSCRSTRFMRSCLPTPRRSTAEERASILAARRKAVRERFEH